MAITEIIDKETGKTIYVAKDGRIMDPKSLENLDNPKTQFKPGQSGNPTGRPKGLDKQFREEILRIAQQPLSAKDKEAALTRLVKKIFRKVLSTNQDNTFIRLTEIIKESIDGKITVDQTNISESITQNILVLPAQNGKIALPEAKNNKDDSTESE